MSLNSGDAEVQDEAFESKSVKSEQAARSVLREKFLKILSLEIGSNCEITTVEGNKLKGQYEGTNYNTSQFLIKNLQTPVATISDALIRSSDIVSMNFPVPQSLALL